MMDSLNQMQLGIAFNYLSDTDSSDPKVFTHISVMHNVRALDPIRDKLPELFSKINQRILASDHRRFYLLDAIGGCLNA